MATKIFAQRYNNLQNRIQTVLGNPTNTTPNIGYGQTVKSSQVTLGTSKVRAQDYTNLVDDMSRALYHQQGSSFPGINPVIPAGSNREKVFETYIQNLESLISTVEANVDTYNATQMEVTSLKNSSGLDLISSRTTTWNTTISYEFNVTFSSLAAYRSFFNTGGEIRIVTTSSYTGTEQKSLNWKSLLQTLGTIRFTPTQTIAAGGSVTNATGGRNIASGQTVSLINYNSGSAVYTQNVFNLSVSRTSNTNLTFTITLTDGPETIDEVVRGTITTSTLILRASGALSGFTIPAPIGSNISPY